MQDLESIRDFIERDSPRYGRVVVERLVEATSRIELFPMSGRVVPELAREDLLDQLGDLQPIPQPARTIRVAYQDACHLSHAQAAAAAPRRLLNLIPGLQLLSIPDAHLCCGSAGTYSMLQPKLAGQLRRNKIRALAVEKPEVIATANVGCQLHIAQGNPVPVRHWVELLQAD